MNDRANEQFWIERCPCCRHLLRLRKPVVGACQECGWLFDTDTHFYRCPKLQMYRQPIRTVMVGLLFSMLLGLLFLFRDFLQAKHKLAFYLSLFTLFIAGLTVLIRGLRELRNLITKKGQYIIFSTTTIIIPLYPEKPIVCDWWNSTSAQNARHQIARAFDNSIRLRNRILDEFDRHVFIRRN